MGFSFFVCRTAPFGDAHLRPAALFGNAYLCRIAPYGDAHLCQKSRICTGCIFLEMLETLSI